MNSRTALCVWPARIRPGRSEAAGRRHWDAPTGWSFLAIRSARRSRLYRNCSVYCLPSFGEPYGTTVVEAMSCARSLVVTDCGALPHLVHERGGLRVPAGNTESLAQALIHLLRHPDERVEMGRYNRRMVESKMSWDSVAQQLEAIYDITLARRAAQSVKMSPAGLRVKTNSADQKQI